jgi:hypothetical protein
MPLILRTVKGSPLTYQEMDDNLTYLSSSLSQSISSSYATTASYALNAGSGGSFPYTGSARITGSLSVTGSVSISGSAVPNGYGFVYASGADNASKTLTTIEGFTKNATRAMIETSDRLGALDLTFVGTGNTSGFSKGLVIPTSQSLNPVNGSICWDSTTSRLLIYDGGTAAWVQVVLGP